MLSLLYYIPQALSVLMILIETQIGRIYQDIGSRRSTNVFDRYFAWIFGFTIFIDCFLGQYISALLHLRTVFPAIFVMVGCMLYLIGYTYRLYSIRYLGKGFSVVLRVTKDHKLITGGPYALVRHPSYLGGWITICGVAVTSARIPIVILVALTVLFLFLLRIKSEEKILVEHIIGYKYYQEKTRMIIPFVL